VTLQNSDYTFACDSRQKNM